MPVLLRYMVKTLLIVLWIVLSIYLGGIAVSVKETLGLNVFKTTGYTALKQCLIQETRKASQETVGSMPSPPVASKEQ